MSHRSLKQLWTAWYVLKQCLLTSHECEYFGGMLVFFSWETQILFSFCSVRDKRGPLRTVVWCPACPIGIINFTCHQSFSHFQFISGKLLEFSPVCTEINIFFSWNNCKNQSFITCLSQHHLWWWIPCCKYAITYSNNLWNWAHKNQHFSFICPQLWGGGVTGEGLPGVLGIKGTSPFTLREQGIFSNNF